MPSARPSSRASALGALESLAVYLNIAHSWFPGWSGRGAAAYRGAGHAGGEGQDVPSRGTLAKLTLGRASRPRWRSPCRSGRRAGGGGGALLLPGGLARRPDLELHHGGHRAVARGGDRLRGPDLAGPADLGGSRRLLAEHDREHLGHPLPHGADPGRPGRPGGRRRGRPPGAADPGPAGRRRHADAGRRRWRRSGSRTTASTAVRAGWPSRCRGCSAWTSGIGSGSDFPRPAFGLLCLVVLVAGGGRGAPSCAPAASATAMLAVRADERSAAAAGSTWCASS